jgi:hypothetical protein
VKITKIASVLKRITPLTGTRRTEVKLHEFYTSAINGHRLASGSGHIYLRERDNGTHNVRGSI